MDSQLSLDELDRLTSTLCCSKFFVIAGLLIHFPGPLLKHRRKLKTNILSDSMVVTRGAKNCRMLSGVRSRDGIFEVGVPFIHGKRIASDTVVSMY
jgi:hypothetical protein